MFAFFQRRQKILLGLIFCLALALRTYQLSNFPVGFHGDEAEIGYNAFSLLKTGRDKNGIFLPLATDQFGDFRPAGYHYTAILPIALFGLNEFSVRLPAAIFGSLTVIVFYFLVKELFSKGVTAAFLLAINPWHIAASRATSESVIALFFVILGAYLFLKTIKTKQPSFKLLTLAYFLFSLSFLFYHAARFFAPILVIFLTIIFKKKRRLLGLNILLLLACIAIFIGARGSKRSFDISIFNSQETQLALEEQIREDENQNTLLTRFFHNKPNNYFLVFLNNYGQHFTTNFLFLKGGFPQRYIVPWTGNLHLISAPFLVLGFAFLLVGCLKKKNRLFSLPIFWLLAGPLPAAFTFEDIPNIQRSIMTLPALIMITAYGFNEFIRLINRSRIHKAAILFACLFLFYNFSSFLHNYFHHSLTHKPWYRNYGEKELIMNLQELAPQYQRIVTTSYDDNNLIFYLFYTQFDPWVFQDLGSPKDKNFLQFQNLTYVYDHCPLKGDEKNEAEGELKVLYVNIGPCQLPKNAEKIKSIRRTDDTEAFQLVKLNYLKPPD